MTLVVARVHKGQIAIVADTMISVGDKRLPMAEWMVKSICLPGAICVSFAGSPELAQRSCAAFQLKYPAGAGESETVSYFENDSRSTGNEYIVAFAASKTIVTICEGRRLRSLSKTHWIGDKTAYERFREHEHRRPATDNGRAIHAAIFADEIEGSPASDLFSHMRATLSDRRLNSVGGFISAISSRGAAFRQSVYSDVLLDWPDEASQSVDFSYEMPIDLKASGENARFSFSQVSPGYCGANSVAFYVLPGQLLVVFHRTTDGRSVCLHRRPVRPADIASTLDELIGFPYRAMCLVMSARSGPKLNLQRTSDTQGVAVALYCEANTMPRS